MANGHHHRRPSSKVVAAVYVKSQHCIALAIKWWNQSTDSCRMSASLLGDGDGGDITDVVVVKSDTDKQTQKPQSKPKKKEAWAVRHGLRFGDKVSEWRFITSALYSVLNLKVMSAIMLVYGLFSVFTAALQSQFLVSTADLPAGLVVP